MANKNVMRYFEKYRGYMEDRVRDGIEQNRKGYGSVTVTDASGAPVQGARVKLRQKRHEFSFGANLFMLEELESEEKNARYKEYFKDLFNLATLPFYWNGLEPKQGKPRFAGRQREGIPAAHAGFVSGLLRTKRYHAKGALPDVC